MRFRIGIAALASGVAISSSVLALDAAHYAADLNKPAVMIEHDRPEGGGLLFASPDAKTSAPTP